MDKIGNLFILGDSYSTFEKHMPEGYAFWYVEGGKDETDVSHVTQTWWYQFIHDTQANLLLNNSYSGSTICNTGYNGEDCSRRSFVGRFDELIEKNYFKDNRVDTCIIFGGTNDAWADSPVGNLMYSNWTKEDLYFALPAFCYLLHRAKENLEDARIVVVINCDLKQSITDGFKSACEKYGVDVIELQNIEKMDGHPSVAGMKQIKEQMIFNMNLV